MVATGCNKLTLQASDICPALEPRRGSSGVIPAKAEGQNGEEEDLAKEDWSSAVPGEV